MIGRPMKTWKKFGDKRYKMLTSYESKKTAETLAKSLRESGSLVRIRPWKPLDGKTLHIIYTRKK